MKKRIVVFFIVFVIFLASNIVLGKNNDLAVIEAFNILENKKYLPVIESYYIEMNVNEDNTINIVETIRTDPKALKYNIQRQLPLENQIKKLDGTEIKKRAKIKDIKISNNCVIYNGKNSKTIKLINNERDYAGKKIFQIMYTYDIGVDTTKKADELFFDLIASGWNVKIDEIAFKIKMPKDFDETKLVFFSENKKDLNVSYVVKDNIINGSFNNALESGKNLAVGLILPQSYFKITSIPYSVLLKIIASIIFLIVIYRFYKKCKSENNSYKEKIYYPPNDIIDISLFNNTTLENKDIVALLIDFANNGYIQIEEYDEKKIKIIKKKEYDGNNENERIVFMILFSSRDEFIIDKWSNIIKEVEQINQNIIREEVIVKKDKKMLLYNRYIRIIIIILLIFLIGPYIYNICKTARLVNALISSFFIILIYFILIIAYCVKPNKIMFMISMFTFSLILNLGFIPTNFENAAFFIEYIVEIFSLIGIVVLYEKILEINSYEYFDEKIRKRLIFKKSIETITKDKVNELVEKDSGYFYTILPYVCIFDLGDKWFEMFRNNNIECPAWYNSYLGFSIDSFKDFINTMYFLLENYSK